MSFKLLVLKRGQPQEKGNLNKEIQYLSSSFGLFTDRDKSSSCFRIFVELLKTTKMRKPISSDELAFKLGLSRGTVVYHLTKLIEAGIAVSQKNKYLLKASSLNKIVKALRSDVGEFFDSMMEVSAEIDKALE